VERNAGPGQVLTNRQEIERTLYMINSAIFMGSMVLGVVFVVLGCLVLRFPLVTTITSLTLFILVQIAFIAIDPHNLYRGIIVKVIVLVVLIKAIQAAGAYEREKRDDLAFDAGQ
jgi:hypothetical protein